MGGPGYLSHYIDCFMPCGGPLQDEVWDDSTSFNQIVGTSSPVT